MAYPVAFQADYRERQSRLVTFFRLLLAIPWLLVSIIWGLLALVGVVCGWFAIVFTGSYPAFAYDWTSKYLRFYTRVTAWVWLLTDEFPPFDGNEHPEYPIRLAVPQPLNPYTRWKTLLRIVLLIPVLILVWLFNILIELVGILAWFVIVFTGKFPKGLWDVQKMGVAYISLANAYHLLVTETYPPITPEDDGAEPAPVTPPPASPPLA
ncbi:DUF4389 domain-containing protein [Conexibacter arvalis]|uniref:DUF4389 domain-containing protein n=1 Tax=Conexibacter arvalis TaxID=912552 RepID=A0A840IJQ1_9ACTN|nr:hypothetical protein [Conexibacter arvalis]